MQTFDFAAFYKITTTIPPKPFTLYAHRADAAALPRVTPYRDYLAWAAAQDLRHPNG